MKEKFKCFHGVIWGIGCFECFPTKEAERKWEKDLLERGLVGPKSLTESLNR
jgi:hypothetical protein